MTIEAKLDQIIATPAPAEPLPPVDISTLATGVEVAALSAKVDALAAIVGTETPVAPVA